eukprot:GHVT01104866.1.p1 GENE.GHVT01104866.1~~GHVT01104866.1.p1  ORF type:complete len:117 (-),score=13.70 GHVT01104866.1:1677-2027(-)
MSANMSLELAGASEPPERDDIQMAQLRFEFSPPFSSRLDVAFITLFPPATTSTTPTLEMLSGLVYFVGRHIRFDRRILSSNFSLCVCLLHASAGTVQSSCGLWNCQRRRSRFHSSE